MTLEPATDLHRASQPAPVGDRRRVIIEGVYPEIDAGRFPIKRLTGDWVDVECDAFCDGHDEVAVELLHRRTGEREWAVERMEALGNDRWRARFQVGQPGRHEYTLRAWVDRFGTWKHDLQKRIDAGTTTAVDLQIGASHIEAAAAGAPAAVQDQLRAYARQLAEQGLDALELAQREELESLVRQYPARDFLTEYGRILEVDIDRERAGFSAWYELFPRSHGRNGAHGTFADVERRLEYVADLGFDIVYLPPIHPIGAAFRKGKNNRVDAEPGDVGSPWAIGGAEGGHTAIHPDLGTLVDFRRLVARAQELGMELALDIAFQASPDHPYVREHANWFRARPDGTIQYAENPPKKYQDIYPFDFESEDSAGLWTELREVFLYWIEQGVRVFRVDNPHTKSLRFWEWCIRTIREQHPDVLFLAEAFTRPKIMYWLAKAGYSQSYTYFTWRNHAAEMRQYLEELTSPPVVDIFRPNFWPNTPDILHADLQTGRRASFVTRFILAATLSTNYGIYGPAFELQEFTPREPGSEEYLDSEKYQLRQWDLDAPHSLAPLIREINRLRREHPALQTMRSLRFHETDNPNLLVFSKQAGDDCVLVATNFDPHQRQAGRVTLDPAGLPFPPDAPLLLMDELNGEEYRWEGGRGYLELDPDGAVAHVFVVRTG